uniref:Glutathione peroxidase 3 n=1 Tax=Nomascus leucogenys TaxID=61853 RepID=A0A2I3H5L8_NOMLE
MARLLQASCLLSLLLAGFVPQSRGQEKSKNMHYRKSLHHLVWSFWAFPATSLENRNQERTQRSFPPSSMSDQVEALSLISSSLRKGMSMERKSRNSTLS